MSPELMNTLIALTAAALALMGAVLIVKSAVSVLRFRPRGSIRRILAGVFLASGAVIGGVLALGLQGYRGLTHEEIAARLTVKPVGPQRFEAKVRFADGRDATYQLAGDEVYVDARILKWHPVLNMLGVHTAYELNRVAGRYQSIEQERSATRTVHSLGREKPVDLFTLRRRFELLRPLVDAQYGSATFIPVSGPADFEIRVSTTGLLMRKVEGLPH